MLRKRTLGNKKKSTYTVYSNCNGGSVYFNNNLVGTISSGVDRSYILLNYTTTDNGYNGSLSVFFNL